MDVRYASQEEVQSAMAEGATPPLLPLGLDMHSCATQDESNKNIQATLDRGYDSFIPYLDKYSGTISLVGSGPSIEDTYKELVGDVCALNGAISYLLDRGIVPDFAMIFDADPVCEKFAVPHPDITYFIASRCHQKVFDRLKDCKVVVWHAGGDHNVHQFLAEREVDEPMVNGGSAAITRAIFLADCLGYRDLHLFGADSSYGKNGNTHVRGSLVHEKDIMVALGDKNPVWFRTTPEWCGQVMEYRSIFTLFTHRNHSKLSVHGDGMLPYMHNLITAMKEHMGEEKFMREMAEQETKRVELDKHASKSYNQLTQPLEEENGKSGI